MPTQSSFVLQTTMCQRIATVSRTAIVVSAVILVLFGGSGIGRSADAECAMQQSADDAKYESYRISQIERHIASNGRYLQYIWLRTRDAVDLGDVSWPTPSNTPSVLANLRTDADRTFGFAHYQRRYWLPLTYYEIMPRTIDDHYYQYVKALGYVATEPGPGTIPLYEWVRDTIKEFGSSYYRDHYYSLNRVDSMARHRYHSVGIIGYVLSEGTTGFVPLFRGVKEPEGYHFLTTDKKTPDLIPLGYVRATKSSDGFFDGELREYHHDGGPSCPRCTDNIYSALVGVKLLHIRAGLIPQVDFPDTTTDFTRFQPTNAQMVALPPLLHFQARQVIAGGGDNPLYQGGLALATFSLESHYDVSPTSLQYAKLLFDFIEQSEELTVVGGSVKGTGFLRRSRNGWLHHPDDQEPSGAKWGASADEMVGVVFGLWHFLRATDGGVDPGYHARAQALLIRIATYLKNHYWIYADSRIYILPSSFVQEAPMVEYGFGTWVFQYAFARVFQEQLGETYSGPDEFAKQLNFIRRMPNVAVDVNVATKALSVAGCLFKLTGSELDLGCGNQINQAVDVFKLAISNMHYVDNQMAGTDNDNFFNHALLLYSSLMVLNTDGHQASKTDICKRLLRYIYRMWGYEGGPAPRARKNLLFAVVGRRCGQIVSSDDERDALDDHPQYHWKGNMLRKEIDHVIEEMIDANKWATGLPLGEPRWTSEMPHVPRDPWEDGPQVLFPDGIGRNQAWESPNEQFAMWNRLGGNGPGSSFANVGAYYVDGEGQWSRAVTLKKLQSFARVGYPPGSAKYDVLDPSEGLQLKIEAGANDYLLLRMLLVDMGVLAKPILTDWKSVIYPVLPIPGEAPW